MIIQPNNKNAILSNPSDIIKNQFMYINTNMGGYISKLDTEEKVKSLTKEERLYIQEQCEKFVEPLNTIVSEFERLVRSRVEELESIELVLMIFMFFVLLLEAFLIFLPAEEKD